MFYSEKVVILMSKETLRQKKNLGIKNKIKVQTRMIYNYKYGYS